MDPETGVEQAVVQQLLQQEIAGENSSQSVQQLCAAVLCYHTLFDNGDKVTGETHIESVQHRQCQCNTKMLTAVFSQATYFLMLTTFQQLLHIIKSYLRS